MCYLKLWDNKVFFFFFFFLKSILGLTISTWNLKKRRRKKKKTSQQMQVAWNHDFDTHFQHLNRKMLFC